jgi:hypothetical protein
MRKSVHVTLSLPEDLKYLLYSTVEKGSISKFVADSLRKALKEKEDILAAAYREAAKDPGQLEAMEDWKSLEGEDFVGVEWDE